MKALVTGSSGFIGSHLVGGLIDRGMDVYGLVRKKSNTEWLEKQRITLIPAEYSDAGSLRSAVQGMDYVFHLAAVIQAPDWDSFYAVNTMGTRNLLSACHERCGDLKRFVYVSSIAASGPSSRGRPRVESDACQPRGGYGKSKFLAEEICGQYRDRMPLVIVRPPNILGVRQKELLTVMRLMKKRIFPMLGNGEKQTTLCFIQDLVEALILVAERKEAIGETYFVTDNEWYSWNEILRGIAGALGVLPYVLPIPHPAMYAAASLSEFVSWFTRKAPLISRERVMSVRRYSFLVDGSKIRRELDFETRIEFREGLREIVDRYRGQDML